MRILVTGGAGFIGSHFVEKLLAVGHEVVVLDDFNDFYDPRIKHANIADFAKDVTVCHVDLRESDSVRTVFGREKIDAIVHLAAALALGPPFNTRGFITTRTSSGPSISSPHHGRRELSHLSSPP